MPWPTGPVSVGVNGENSRLHIVIDQTAEQPSSSMVSGTAAQAAAIPDGSFMEMMLGHRSGGTLTASPLLGLGSVNFGQGAAVTYGNSTLTDTTKNWATNSQAGKIVYTNAGQYNIVASNTATVLTMKSVWATNPANNTGYVLWGSADQNQGATVTYAATTLTDTAKAWTVNQWAGFFVYSQAGLAKIASNTATVLTLADGGWPTTPAANRAYGIAEPLFQDWLTTQRGTTSGQKVFGPNLNPDNL